MLFFDERIKADCKAIVLNLQEPKNGCALAYYNRHILDYNCSIHVSDIKLQPIIIELSTNIQSDALIKIFVDDVSYSVFNIQINTDLIPLHDEDISEAKQNLEEESIHSNKANAESVSTPPNKAEHNLEEELFRYKPDPNVKANSVASSNRAQTGGFGGDVVRNPIGDISTLAAWNTSYENELDQYAAQTDPYTIDNMPNNMSHNQFQQDVSGNLPPLPINWKTYYNSDGIPYYFNSHTGETTWKRPQALATGTWKRPQAVYVQVQSQYPSSNYVPVIYKARTSVHISDSIDSAADYGDHHL
eukprot:21247_1